MISGVVCICLLLAGLLAMRLCQLLPPTHMNSETKDTVKLSMGLLATMTALVLGLLVASSKSSYDTESTAVTTISAKILVLDRILAHYGSEAKETRVVLKEAVERMVSVFWTETDGVLDEAVRQVAPGEALYDSIQKLVPRDAAQQSLKTQALESAMDIDRSRWLLLFERSISTISMPLLLVVVCWQSILFFSFGLFAPSNAISKVALGVSAIAAAGAIFLILEMDSPFDGWIKISKGRMELALSHLGK